MGTFPKIWSDGIIVPLHKKDDKLDTNNYRGIVISSCLGKLLLRILTKGGFIIYVSGGGGILVWGRGKLASRFRGGKKKCRRLLGGAKKNMFFLLSIIIQQIYGGLE